MSGIDMARAILEIDPNVKILLMSGYSDEVIELRGRNQFPFVRKPFIYSMLVEKIRSIVKPIDAAASAT